MCVLYSAENEYSNNRFCTLKNTIGSSGNQEPCPQWFRNQPSEEWESVKQSCLIQNKTNEKRKWNVLVVYVLFSLSNVQGVTFNLFRRNIHLPHPSCVYVGWLRTTALAGFNLTLQYISIFSPGICLFAWILSWNLWYKSMNWKTVRTNKVNNVKDVEQFQVFDYILTVCNLYISFNHTCSIQIYFKNWVSIQCAMCIMYIRAFFSLLNLEYAERIRFAFHMYVFVVAVRLHFVMESSVKMH